MKTSDTHQTKTRNLVKGLFFAVFKLIPHLKYSKEDGDWRHGMEEREGRVPGVLDMDTH